MKNKIILGDCLEVLKILDENSIDACVTDPPYALGFMGKAWDKFPSDTGAKKPFANQSKEKKLGGHSYQKWLLKIAKEIFRVLKPGGYLLSFGGTRTYHRMACAIEDAGFEIRDMIAWVYGSGFPKSLNIGKAIEKMKGIEPLEKIPNKDGRFYGQVGSDYHLTPNQLVMPPLQTDEAKQWSGWGTALKPALEPITVARKPLSEKTVAENCFKWGTGGININGCRVEYGNETDNRIGTDTLAKGSKESIFGDYSNIKDKNIRMYKDNGRFPANLIHDGSDKVVSLFPNSKSSDAVRHNNQSKYKGIYEKFQDKDTTGFNDSGSNSRFPPNRPSRPP